MSEHIDRHIERVLAEERRRWLRSAMLWAAILAAVAAAGQTVGLFDAQRLAQAIPSLLTLGKDMVPPAFTDVGRWTADVAITLTMSVIATAIGVLISFPLGFLAAANTSPHFVVYQLARAALNLLRTIPELIYGVLFVAAVGFGPLAGALALSLHSAGMVGKFFAEAVEHASPQPVEAVRATGARPLQIILHGVLPQVVPQFVDISIYRWEHNFRASTVMGMVGAGGIGFDLIASLRLIQYQEVCAILLIIFATVTVVDGTGAWLRRRVH